MAQKWNLGDIRPAGASRERTRKSVPRPQSQDIAPRQLEERHHAKEIDPDLASIDIVDGGSRRMKRIFSAVAVALVIIVAGFFTSTYLGGAEITVHPKYKDTTVQATFTAYKEPKAGELGYELLKLEADGERQVSATGEEEVSERAKGTVFIYNAYSETPQRLIKNTRFESADGLIFRISESVEVPGSSVDESGKTIPGVITAEVFADGTGEQYNIAPGRFTVPGLRDTDQYDKMYAESTASFTGGFEGSKFIIDEGELRTAKQALHLELRNALLARLTEERPAGSVVYDGAVTFAYDSLPATEYGDKLATIKERVRLQVPIFKAEEFASYLAKNTVAGYEGEPVEMPDPFSLQFSYPGATTTSSDISTETELTFNLSGNTRIVWGFDEEKLQNDLTGLSKTALPSVLGAYPAILRAEAVVRPFWTQSFPDNPSEITVTNILGDSEGG